MLNYYSEILYENAVFTTVTTIPAESEPLQGNNKEEVSESELEEHLLHMLKLTSIKPDEYSIFLTVFNLFKSNLFREIVHPPPMKLQNLIIMVS